MKLRIFAYLDDIAAVLVCKKEICWQTLNLYFPFMKSTVYALKRYVTFADQEVVSMGGWGPRDIFFSSMGPSLTSLNFSGMGVWALCHPVDPACT